MTNDQKLVELEKIMRKQDTKLMHLVKQVALLERENSRRKVEIAKLQNASSNNR